MRERCRGTLHSQSDGGLEDKMEDYQNCFFCIQCIQYAVGLGLLLPAQAQTQLKS